MNSRRTHKTWRKQLENCRMHGDRIAFALYVAKACERCTQRRPTVGTPGEFCQVELNLVPAVIQPHRHCADEILDPGGRLVVAGSKTAAHVLVIQNCDFECEVSLHVLDLHSSRGNALFGTGRLRRHR